MAADPARLRALMQSVTDGEPVNWDEVSAGADETRQRLLRELRLVARVAEVHRTAGATPDLSEDSTYRLESSAVAGEAPLGRWGHLELIEKIGEGAFGEVYRARDPWLSREIALKLLKPSVASRVSPDRMIREGQTLARLKHPNVVTVYGADRHDDRAGLVHGTRARAHAQPDPGRPGTVQRERSDPDRARSVSRAVGGARSRPGSRRRQGPERHARVGRPAAADGFRCGRHADLPGTRGARRRSGDHRVRHLRVGSIAVSARHRPLSGHQPDGRRPEAGALAPGARAVERPAARSARRVRRGGRACHPPRCVATVRERARHARRPGRRHDAGANQPRPALSDAGAGSALASHVSRARRDGAGRRRRRRRVPDLARTGRGPA